MAGPLPPLSAADVLLVHHDWQFSLLVKGQAGAIPPDFHGFPSEEITGFRTLDVAFVIAPIFAR
jgi:hypothetical protein